MWSCWTRPHRSPLIEESVRGGDDHAPHNGRWRLLSSCSGPGSSSFDLDVNSEPTERAEGSVHSTVDPTCTRKVSAVLWRSRGRTLGRLTPDGGASLYDQSDSSLINTTATLLLR